MVPLLASLLAVVSEPSADWSTTDLSFLGSDTSEYAQSRAICARVIDAEPPAGDRPTVAEAKSLKDCDSEALYYGIGVQADPAKARKCAFVEADQFSADGINRHWPFAGRAMLSVIYANGVGADRNLDVATHLACGLHDAAAEMDGRIKRMAELQAKRWAGRDFTLCDDATSGFLAGECVGHDSRIEKAKRDSRMEALARHNGFAGSPKWRELLEKTEAYVEARAYGELDLSGTMRGVFMTAAIDEVRDEFIETVSAIANGTIARATRAQRNQADAALNRVYRRFMSDPTNFSEAPGVQQSGVRAAERAWIAYRDAMLTFARIHYPRASQDAIATLLTRARTRQLEHPIET